MIIAHAGSRLRVAIKLLALAAAAQFCCAGAVAAPPEGDTFGINVFSSIGYDDNVFRLSPDAPTLAITGSDSRGDAITILGLTASADWRVGRQRLLVDATVTDNHYSRFGFLDYPGWDLRGNLKWELGGDWFGELTYSSTKALTSFGDFRLPVKNIQTLERTGVTGYYRLFPRFRVKAGASRVSFTNDTPARAVNDREEKAYEAGIQFQSSQSNVLGLQARRTDGRYPNRTLIAGSMFDGGYAQTDLEGTLDWQVGGSSKLVGYLGHTSRRHNELPIRDFSGPAGRLRYEWRPAGKLSFDLALRREIGAYEDTESSYVLTRGVSIGSVWYATGKISANARLERRIRDYLGDPGFVVLGQPAREDTIDTATLGVSYGPLRNLQLSLSLTHEERSSNRPQVGYRDNSIFATAQFTF